jgi:hypothetical protein
LLRYDLIIGLETRPYQVGRSMCYGHFCWHARVS